MKSFLAILLSCIVSNVHAQETFDFEACKTTRESKFCKKTVPIDGYVYVEIDFGTGTVQLCPVSGEAPCSSQPNIAGFELLY